jgi:hypothetical protein
MATTEAFRQTYDEMLSAVPRSVRVVLATVACLGENPESDINKTRNRYNEAIRTIGERHGAGIADVAKAFDTELQKVDKPSAYFLDRHSSVFLDSLVTAPDAGSDYLAPRHGSFSTGRAEPVR